MENAQALEKELAAREKCLLAGVCPPPKASREEKKKQASVKTETSILPLKIIARENPDEAFGPYFTDSGCWGWQESGEGLGPKTHPFFVLAKGERLRIEQASEAYYLDHGDIESWKPGEIYLKLGIRYYGNPATNDYRCTDLTYWPEVFEEVRRELHPGNASGWEEKTAQISRLWFLPYFLDNAARDLQILTWNQEIEKKAASALYLLTARNDYSLMYLTHTASAWRLAEKPVYLVRENFPVPKGNITYTELKKRGEDLETINALNEERLTQYEVLQDYLGLKSSPAATQNLFSDFLETYPFSAYRDIFR